DLPRSLASMSVRTVMIVEDSPTMRQLLIFALKRLKNLRVVEAGDGVEALKKLNQEKTDLFIIDINMPVMDGLKLIGILRQNPEYKDVPIVIVTTEGAEEDRKRALALGANVYITKPVHSATLLKTVSELLHVSEAGE
ncbi:MAG: response regulator, partial [Acidobacteriota bacterium]|nr:response regulator [Acidobacteriota bacterium]